MGGAYLKEGITIYYHIGEKIGKLEVMHTIFMNDSTDSGRISNKNVFRSSSDAQKILDKINKVFEGGK